jgi:N,N'-diacetyllegionaminate synthase
MGKVFIIAEAGVNHNGSLEIAKKLVAAAKNAGADAVKFQTFKTDKLVSKNAQKADYQKNNTGSAQDKQRDMLTRLELPYDAFRQIKKYCDELGITFLSTPFDFESIDFLSALEMPVFKIASGEITNLPYLIKIAQTKKNVILSTGMCEMREISDALKILDSHGAPKVSLLHCTTEYPAPFEEVNLKAMSTLRDAFKRETGYSDHTVGIEVSVAATAMGADIIEKHFTLDKNMVGPDHKASLDPKELSGMVQAIRNVEKALGDAEKKPTASELKNRVAARKSLVAARNIVKGEPFSGENIAAKRPGSGISPMEWFEVIGKKAPRDFDEDELIEL